MKGVGLFDRGKRNTLQQLCIALDAGHGSFQFVGKGADKLTLGFVHFRQGADVFLDPLRHLVEALGDFTHLIGSRTLHTLLIVPLCDPICRIAQKIEGGQDSPENVGEQHGQKDGQEQGHNHALEKEQPSGLVDRGDIAVVEETQGAQ